MLPDLALTLAVAMAAPACGPREVGNGVLHVHLVRHGQALSNLRNGSISLAELGPDDGSDVVFVNRLPDELPRP